MLEIVVPAGAAVLSEVEELPDAELPLEPDDPELLLAEPELLPDPELLPEPEVLPEPELLPDPELLPEDPELPDPEAAPELEEASCALGVGAAAPQPAMNNVTQTIRMAESASLERTPD